DAERRRRHRADGRAGDVPPRVALGVRLDGRASNPSRTVRGYQRAAAVNRGPPGLVTAGRADPAELPVAAIRGGDDLLGLARLRTDVVADRHVALDDGVPERPQPVDLDLNHVA